MAGETQGDVVVPSVNSQAPATAPVKAPAPVATSATDDVAELKKAVELQKREKIVEVKRWKNATEQEKKTSNERAVKIAEYEKRIAEIERRDQYAKLNPVSHLKSLYGDNWHEFVNTIQANGGAPTADTVAAEISRMREDFDKKLSDKDAKDAEQQKAAQLRAMEDQAQAFVSRGAAWIDENKSEFPLLVKRARGDAAQAAQWIANCVGQEWGKAIKPNGARDPDPSHFKPAAELIEAELLRQHDEALEVEKYAERFRNKLTPAKTAGIVPGVTKSQVVPSSLPQKSQLKTLSNDLTGSTGSSTSPSRSDEARRKQLYERFDTLSRK